jgi:hypothetical protein
MFRGTESDGTLGRVEQVAARCTQPLDGLPSTSSLIQVDFMPANAPSIH